MPKSDVIIIGSGIAALMTAFYVCEHKNVIIFTKSNKETSNSWHAQGGVAVVTSDEDHWCYHFDDTIAAGCYHNDQKAVEILVKEGPILVRELIDKGLRFDTDEKGQLQLGQEGAHRLRRILHAGGDATGRTIVTYLIEKLADKVAIMEDEQAVELIMHKGRCVGVKTRKNTGETKCYYAPATVIATGGCGSIYTFSSNASTATGDGIALAYRAGAAVVDMEFIQFHPTMLYAEGKAVGLASEAIRGEGAILIDSDGRKIMESVHPQKDLAPRDVVARAIHHEILAGNQIYLDISMIPNFSERFPTITALCRSNGIAIEDGKLPVVPGAHFLMGGIKVNVNGQTTLPGLFAVGEAACTGVHGANRLASNSLLEGIVFGKQLALTLLNYSDKIDFTVTLRHEKSDYVKKITNKLPTKESIQKIMMDKVGIIRNESSLRFAKKWFEQFAIFDLLDVSLDDLTMEEITNINMLIIGWIITTSALKRTESRGGHYRTDYPDAADSWKGKRILRTREELLVNI